VLVVISVTKYQTVSPHFRFFEFKTPIGELFPQKNQELEIFNFTKVMAKKVKKIPSFFEKVAMV
jgi:hypothetical protein